MLEKHEVKIWPVTMKYAHTHTAFVEALNKILAEIQGSRCPRVE